MRRPGLGVYLLAGWPDVATFMRALGAVGEAADFVELGLPSRNPKYDGPFIRRAHAEAEPVKLARVSGEAFLMAYWEDFAGSPGELFSAAVEVGAAGVLAPDLLIDYPGELQRYIELSRAHGLELAFFLPGKFPHALLRRLASLRPAFIYLGLYAATGVELPVYVERNIRLARELAGDAYLVTGFAIDNPSKAAAVIKAGADAVVVGTAFLRRLKSSVEEAVAFLRELRRALEEQDERQVDKHVNCRD
ncbi:MAG: tryptophan synthase subunit alpha [Thermoproteaceae archaeon]|nr:tryptophan synthase subunit alpha [Thermoproteaceae archaeon]